MVYGALAVPRLPNVGYLGQGYNIFEGNPRSSRVVDPGFRQPVLGLTYEDGLTTADGKYAIPDNTNAEAISLCDSKTETKTISGAKSYYESLTTDVSFDIKGFGASFSLSTDFKKVQNSTSTHENIFTDTKATCSVYKIDAGVYTTQAAADISVGIQYLPLSFSSDTSDALFTFIDNYGTHYLSGVEMGGRFGQRLEFSKETWTKFHENDVDITASAGFSFIVSVGSKVENDHDQQMAESFSRSSQSQTQYHVGGQYSKDAATWMATVGDSPMPVTYTLKRLDEVLQPYHLPQMDSDVLSQQKAALSSAIDAYCARYKARGELASCEEPDNDVPLEMRTSGNWANKNFAGNTNGIKECPVHQYVTELTWREQSGYGLINMQFKCTDGSEYSMNSNFAGSWDRTNQCTGGFQKTKAREQVGYGIVNFLTYCVDDVISQTANGNYGGAWDSQYDCPSWAPVIAGFETQEQSGYGIVNYRPRCSNGNVFSSAEVAAIV